MATSKEKKRYHLTATSDGWAQTGQQSQGEGAVSRTAKQTPRPRPRRRP